MTLFTNLSTSSLKTFAIPSDVPSVAIRDFSTVGSHSWTEIDGDPAIAVPGCPPKWLEPRLPLRVPADEGLRFIDHTGAQCERLGVSRLLPLIQAVEICTPTFDFRALSILCNRNNLRNLLSWIEGPADTVKDFRIDLHLANGGKTLVMVQYEVNCTELTPGGTFRGFGDNFRKSCVEAVAGQTKHNRVVTFRLGDLRLLMEHKVEAYADERRAARSDDMNSLISSFGRIRITDRARRPPVMSRASAPTSATSVIFTDGKVRVQKTKDTFKDYNFVEVKTMAQRKTIDWRIFHPQLYLSQTKQVLVARHARGQFVSIEKHQLNDEALRQQTEHTEQTLGRLVEFMRRLFVALKASGSGPWALVCTNGTLKLHKSTELPPQDVLSRFE